MRGANQPVIGWLGGQLYPLPTRVQVPGMTLVLVFFWIYSRPLDNVRLVGGDAPIDYEVVCDDFVNLKMMCRLSFSGCS